MIDRFLAKVDKGDGSTCWNWTASLAGKGYGQIKIPGTRRQIYAHILSYQWFNGEIPEGQMVCHICDNPKCVKPDHLFLGSGKENLQDMKAKDRHLKGERNKQVKLTEAKVNAIHDALEAGESTYSLADRFGVAQSTIFKISHGKLWEHIFLQRRRK